MLNFVLGGTTLFCCHSHHPSSRVPAYPGEMILMSSCGSLSDPHAGGGRLWLSRSTRNAVSGLRLPQFHLRPLSTPATDRQHALSSRSRPSAKATPASTARGKTAPATANSATVSISPSAKYAQKPSWAELGVPAWLVRSSVRIHRGDG